MRFEIGKYYVHTGGRILHVIGAVKSTLYGWCLVGEFPDNADFQPLGVSDEYYAVGWTETTEEEWLKHYPQP